jgi:hypothetical protein
MSPESRPARGDDSNTTSAFVGADGGADPRGTIALIVARIDVWTNAR